MKRSGFLAFALVAALGTISVPAAAPRAQQAGASADGDAALKPTSHPPLPADLTQLWMAPSRARSPRPASVNEFTDAIKLEADGDFAKAPPMLSNEAGQQGTLGRDPEHYKRAPHMA